MRTKGFVSWRDGSFGIPVLGSEAAHLGECDGHVLGVNGVQNALVPNLRLRNQRDSTAQIGRVYRSGHFSGGQRQV